MIVSLLVAMDEKRGIGFENRLPWRLPADLRRFKALTMGHHLIMGRKTFESIGRPLPGRTTVIVTRDSSFAPPGCPGDWCLIAYSLEQALAIAGQRGESESFVIGGAQIFARALDLASRIYLTTVHAVLEADVYFPSFAREEWLVVDSAYHPADDRHPYPYTFELLEKKN